MTKKLEELLNLNNSEPEARAILPVTNEESITTQAVATKLQTRIESYDKIASALPRVGGLGSSSDKEFDELANKAIQAFDDLMDLGMNVEAKYSGRLFEVAANMLSTAVAAKGHKIDKKLKVVDLQLKKLNIEKRAKQAKKEEPENESVETEGFIVSDRNSILKQLKDLKK
jgi:hypothetical protein